MRKSQYLSFVLKRSYICYYIICMTAPLNVGGLRNQSNTVEVDNYVFCKSPLQFATIMLEVYLKLKSKRPDGVVLPIIAFPFKDRMKKCTRLLMFGR